MKASSILLSPADQQNLLRLAADTLFHHFGLTSPYRGEQLMTPALENCCGLFVSLYHRGKLRGCIGQFQSDQPLFKLIQSVTLSSAFHDHRFEPLQADELRELTLEISVLTPLEAIQSPDELELGKHGIYIRKGFQSGTFLPQVATKTHWSKEEFVANCSQNKAGLGRDGWHTAELFRYEALIFSGPLPALSHY
ncbi:MAG: AmmeMemoRadiSam system protein A [Prolixibacteraceae bacterium]|nr:AmmeMemoRadiSam system protein A [Prolixibacteraceae bacterium]